MKTRYPLQEDLLEYYYGAISDEKRTWIEEQLITSQSVLMEFITLKRGLEVPVEQDLLPSAAAKKRLQAEVMSAFSVKKENRSLWMNWIPLKLAYSGIVAVGVVLLVWSGNSLLKTYHSKPAISSPVDSLSDQQSRHRLIDSAQEEAARAHYL